MKGSVFSLLGTNLLKTTGWSRLPACHTRPRRPLLSEWLSSHSDSLPGTGLTQVHPVQGHPPLPGGDRSHQGRLLQASMPSPRIVVTLWARPWSALAFTSRVFIKTTEEAGPSEWYKGLLSVDGSGKVPERFNNIGCSAGHPGSPRQMVFHSHLSPARSFLCVHP